LVCYVAVLLQVSGDEGFDTDSYSGIVDLMSLNGVTPLTLKHRETPSVSTTIVYIMSLNGGTPLTVIPLCKLVYLLTPSPSDTFVLVYLLQPVSCRVCVCVRARARVKTHITIMALSLNCCKTALVSLFATIAKFKLLQCGCMTAAHCMLMSRLYY